MSAQQRIHLNPNAPRQPMMGQGYTPNPAPRSTSGVGIGADDDSPWTQIQKWSSKAEDLIEAYTQVSGVPASSSSLPSHCLEKGCGMGC